MAIKPPIIPSTKRKAPPPPPDDTIVTTKFKVGKWTGEKEGERVIIYADTGMGKTTLCATSPKPVFVGLDEGGRKIKNPLTGDDLAHIEFPEGFGYPDIVAALQQFDLYDHFDTVVVDTITLLEGYAVAQVLDKFPLKGGQRPISIESYGWKQGYRHLYEVMRNMLPVFDALIRRGKNVVLVAQGTDHRVTSSSSDDFIRSGPRLYGGRPSIEALYCEWADDVIKIDYFNTVVKDKKIGGDTTRALYLQPEVWFRAKSRTIHEPVITFHSPADDSLWKFMFPEGDK